MQIPTGRAVPAALALGLGATLVLAPAPATAEETAATTCRGSYVLTVVPGLSTEPTRGTAYTEKPGTMRCDGPVLGKRVLGKGTITNMSRMGVKDPDSCLDGGEGWGAIVMRLPVAGGKTVAVHTAGDYQYGGIRNGLLTGSYATDRMSGTFTVTPLVGNCVTSTVTKARIDLVGRLHAYRVPK